MSYTLVDQSSQRAASFWHIRVVDAGLVLAGSLLMAACAHASIPLGFTPVPITLQTFGVMLLALSLGGWRASAALIVYLLEGISGLPVFSPHGLGGIAQIVGPTGGYLMAYPFAGLVAGLLAERLSKRARTLSLVAGAVICDFLVFAAGALWLLLITHKSPASILAVAVLPFIPGEILKGAAAVATSIGCRRILA